MTYPWLTYSSQTLQRQREINILAIGSGRCPPVVEDGKLGPNTCGAADPYIGVSPNLAQMKKSCLRSTNHRGYPCNRLPWNTQAKETMTLQTALNTLLTKQGFCALKVDGVLGPKTCAGAKKVMGSTNAQNMGCASTGVLDMCAAAANTTQAIAPPTVTTPPPLKPSEAPVPVADEPTRVTVEPVAPPPPEPIPAAQVAPVVAEPLRTPEPAPAPAPVPAPSEPSGDGMTTGKWAILGVGVLAVGAGTYFLLKKKRR